MKRNKDLPGGRPRRVDTYLGAAETRIEGHEYTSWPFRKSKSSMAIYQVQNFLKVHFFIVLLLHSKRRIPWHGFYFFSLPLSLRRGENQKLSPDYAWLRSLWSIWNGRQCVYIILCSDNQRPRQTTSRKSNKYLNSTPSLHHFL